MQCQGSHMTKLALFVCKNLLSIYYEADEDSKRFPEISNVMLGKINGLLGDVKCL